MRGEKGGRTFADRHTSPSATAGTGDDGGAGGDGGMVGVATGGAGALWRATVTLNCSGAIELWQYSVCIGSFCTADDTASWRSLTRGLIASTSRSTALGGVAGACHVTGLVSSAGRGRVRVVARVVDSTASASRHTRSNGHWLRCEYGAAQGAAY